VHVDLPGYTKEGVKILQARCEELHLQPRGKIFIFEAFYDAIVPIKASKMDALSVKF
jgi:hypothetical protein